jgi:hypothetical protein
MEEAMARREQLLSRLDAIGAALARRGDALALLGLGSAGLENDRLDAFSDLDFFVIVEPGAKPGYLADLGWLAEAAELAWSFRNTVDGFKVLFADGVFGEFAVFEPLELGTIAFAEGRIVWKQPQVDPAIRIPARGAEPVRGRDPDWCLGEALSCLLVGMGRYRRGEWLSAQRLVQQHAVDRLVELVALTESPGAGSADPFSAERRFESRFPATAPHLAEFIQGYLRTPESARAILGFLGERFPVITALAARVAELIVAAMAERNAAG